MPMEENERWSIHLESLKLAIGLSTALLAAAAAIFVDNSKIPADDSRYLLLFGVAAFVPALIFSLVSLAYLGNHMVYFGTPAAVTVPPNRRVRTAVIALNISFCFLLGAALLLGAFFGVRTVHPGDSPIAQAVATGRNALQPFLDRARDETGALTSFERRGDQYRLVFAVSPGPGNIIVTTDAAGAVISAGQAAGPGAPDKATDLKELQNRLSAQRKAIDDIASRIDRTADSMQALDRRLGGMTVQVNGLDVRLQRIEQPRSEEEMTRAQIMQVQQTLNARGFDSGKVDGIIGRRTRRGIRAWQVASGAAVTGALTAEQISKLLPAPPVTR
jgi:hypothetical protein